MSLIGIFRERATLVTFDDIAVNNPKVRVANPLRIVVRLMSTYRQWVPQPNGASELQFEHRFLLVEKLS